LLRKQGVLRRLGEKQELAIDAGCKRHRRESATVAIPLANSLDVFAQLPVVESVDPTGKKTIICAQPQLAALCSFLI
jgi:hypothetical protein